MSASVQCFGKKKTATAVAHCKAGRGLLKINGSPIELVQPEILRLKVYEPILIAGVDKFANVDIRVRVSGGGHTSQVLLPRLSSLTTRSSLTSSPRTRSRLPSSSTTVPSWSPTPVAPSPRSSEERVPAPSSRSLTVKAYALCGQPRLRSSELGWTVFGKEKADKNHWATGVFSGLFASMGYIKSKKLHLFAFHTCSFALHLTIAPVLHLLSFHLPSRCTHNCHLYL
ncbi:hypothetical protein G7K_1078-t1 [Saitoella complicata NRRL Y-17804]|uniref:40S ribosomal protein S16 n=1 Tax=Saitoella complicata (strain BCRC 22490 / CBS 7301 / JCM 7358 / NBRC 10748 / NRRL Y-17804) TaxID=698492 RepID=A0A0E9NBV7_SAICN|nr:hypothetical protein G7K_1078-t1 [Saitoella complicata NRRL Y-17804]